MVDIWHRVSLGLLDISIEPCIRVHKLLRIYVAVYVLPLLHALLQVNCVPAELIAVRQHLHVLLLAYSAAVVEDLLVELLYLHQPIFNIIYGHPTLNSHGG